MGGGGGVSVDGWMEVGGWGWGVSVGRWVRNREG